MKQDLFYPELSYEICGLLFKTHNELGRYCNEKQFGDFLEAKLKENKINTKENSSWKNLFQKKKSGEILLISLLKIK